MWLRHVKMTGSMRFEAKIHCSGIRLAEGRYIFRWKLMKFPDAMQNFWFEKTNWLNSCKIRLHTSFAFESIGFFVVITIGGIPTRLPLRKIRGEIIKYFEASHLGYRFRLITGLDGVIWLSIHLICKQWLIIA